MVPLLVRKASTKDVTMSVFACSRLNGSDSFPFDPDQAQTLMVVSLIDALLASNGNIRLASILVASRTNQSRIFAPGMHKDISGRDNVRSTVRNDVRKAGKLDTTVDRPTTDERNMASSQIVECTPKKYLPRRHQKA